jgi:6-phosphogluconate dehydrogenase
VGDGAGRRPDREHHPRPGNLLASGDIIIDGGNTRDLDDRRRAPLLAERGIRYVDVGTSGGLWGLGIEYGLMQAYAEGFELLSASEYQLELPAIARLWTRGSVVRSWLLDLAADALAADPKLEGLKPWVEDSGEGRWTVEDAVAKGVPAPAITAALYARFRSRRDNSFADRLLAALRHAFGGHAVRR